MGEPIECNQCDKSCRSDYYEIEHYKRDEDTTYVIFCSKDCMTNYYEEEEIEELFKNDPHNDKLENTFVEMKFLDLLSIVRKASKEGIEQRNLYNSKEMERFFYKEVVPKVRKL